MRVLLINAVSSRKSMENIYPSLGLGYLAAYLRQHLPGVHVKVIEGAIDEELERFAPDVVGLSSVSQNYGIACAIARTCHKRGLPVIVGGTHISTLPQSLTSDMDVGVIGEGEETLMEIVDTLLRKGPGPGQFKDIAGLAYRDEAGHLILTPDRKWIEPLDRIPFPARDILRVPCHGQLHLFSSRGCPYRCTFCQSTRFFTKTRSFSPAYVVRELEHVLDHYKPMSISFYDDLFVADRARLREIVGLIEERGINRKTDFFVNVRANQANEETADLLKRMNVTIASIGLESGNEEVLQFLKPRSSSVKQNRRAIEVMRDAGIRVDGTFIIGSPGERRKQIEETYEFIKRSRLSYFSTYVLVPLPNTPLWAVAKDKGLVADDMDWNKLRMDLGPDLSSDRVTLSDLPRAELIALYRRFRRLEIRRKLKTRLTWAARHPLLILPTLVKKLKLWGAVVWQPVGHRSHARDNSR